MAYRSLKIWTIPVWTKWKPWKSGRTGKTLRCCVGAVISLKRDLLSSTGFTVRNINQSAMDASKVVGEGQSAEHQAVSLFREYLKIETVHPDPDYDTAVIFLSRIAKEIGLEVQCIEVHPKKPVVIMKWAGKDETLPSILLNSHTDVVPVFPEHWKHDPFGAIKEENGDIYARGTQDMKCVGIQYLEAVRRLKADGKKFLRNIYLTFVPDEEIGGALGMGKFVESDVFKAMNVGFALDEGLANPTEAFKVYNGQRSTWWVQITCRGNPGHGSRFVENTAVEKLVLIDFLFPKKQKVVNQIMEYRSNQKSKLHSDACLHLGDVTTCNINSIQGGVQLNVVPAEFKIGVDIRISHDNNLQEFEEKIKGWVTNAGEDVSYELIQRSDSEDVSSADANDPWWKAFTEACANANVEIEREIFPAGTDSRYLRKIGIPAFGFSPMNNTPILLHDHNEFLNENVFLKGIDIFYEIISSLADVGES